MARELLLVDDEPDAAELFRQSLRREILAGEYELRFAMTGEEALALLAASGAAERILLLCDINMPGMSGLDVLREVRKRWPRLRVIMITAYGDAANRSRAIDNGASEFMSKPVDFARLKALLRGDPANGED